MDPSNQGQNNLPTLARSQLGPMYSSTIYILKASLTDSEEDAVLSISADGTTIHTLPT